MLQSVQREFYTHRNLQPLPKPQPNWGVGHPLPSPHSLGVFGVSLFGAFGASHSTPLKLNPVSAPGNDYTLQCDC